MRRTGMQFLGVTVVLALGCGGGTAGETGGASTGAATTGAATTGAAGSGTGSTGGTSEVAPTTGGDTSTGDVPAACGEGEPADPPIEWDPGQPEIAGCSVRGQREYRAIMHLHSHHSHDACDGDPQPNGVPDEACLQDLRDALCVTRIDLAMLTDHPVHASEWTLEELLVMRGMDEPVLGSEGTPIASWLVCDSGHRVLVMAGIESAEMMPMGLEEHVVDAYGVSSPAAFQQIKDAGALAWVAHTESRDVAELVADLPQVTACADPYDNFLLAMIVAGRADHLVTGDKRDLLAMVRYEGARIIAVRDFLAMFGRWPKDEGA